MGEGERTDEFPAHLVERLSELAKVDPSRRADFAALIVHALNEAWKVGPSWTRRDFDPDPLMASLESIQTLTIKLRERIASVDKPTADFFRLFDIRVSGGPTFLTEFGGLPATPVVVRLGPGLPEYEGKLSELAEKVASTLAGLRATQTLRPAHRAPIDPWDSAAERFTAMVYGAALYAGGRLTADRNGSGKKHPGGTLRTCLDLLAPYLPSGLNPPASASALSRIKRFSDRKWKAAHNLSS